MVKVEKQNELYFLLGYQYGVKKLSEINSEGNHEVFIPNEMWDRIKAITSYIANKMKDINVMQAIDELNHYCEKMNI